MPKPSPVTMLVTYRPKQGHEEELLALVRKHWPALHQVGLVTQEPVRIWRATDKASGDVSIVEMFQWKDADASGIAHRTPEVMAIWEPMEAIIEELKLASLDPVS